MLNSHNEWDQLKEVIVGSIGKKYLIPIVKKKEFTTSEIKLIKKCSKEVFPSWMLNEAAEDLDNLCKILLQFKVKVYRPNLDHTGKIHKTPYWSAIGETVYNARDLNLIVGNSIIESPSQEKYRLFENFGYYEIFYRYFKQGASWVSAPKPSIKTNNIINIKKKKEKYQKLTETEINFEAANILRMGKDILYLVSRSGNYQGARWLQNILGNKYKVHITDGIYRSSHIDSTIMVLKPGLVLLNGSRVNKYNCPKIFKKWDKFFFNDIVKTPNKILDFHNDIRKKNYKILKKNKLFSDINHIASDWIGMNFLSINKNTVVVDKIQNHLIKLLEKLNFNVIPVSFRNSYFLKGGLHCCTLDTVRDSKYESYT